MYKISEIIFHIEPIIEKTGKVADVSTDDTVWTVIQIPSLLFWRARVIVNYISLSSGNVSVRMR